MTPAKPSPAVVAAGFVSLAFSVALILGAILFGLVAALGSGRPAARVMTIISGIFLLVAAFGVALARGFFRLQPWARNAARAWATVMVLYSGIILCAGGVLLLRVSPTAVRAGGLLTGALLLIAGSPGFLVGVWWLILFKRKKVIAEFAEPPRPTQPVNEVVEPNGTTEPAFIQDPGPPDAFTVLRARAVLGSMGLAILATIGMVLVFLLAARVMGVRGAAFPSALMLGLTQLFLYGFIALFLSRLLRRAGVNPRMLLGRAIRWEQVIRYWQYWGLPILLMGMSLTGYFALYFPLSFVLPRFVDRYALQSQSELLHYSGFGFQLGNILTMLAVVVIAPIVEEFVFRGVLLTRWSIKWGTPRAVLLSSAIFGVLHTEILGHLFFGYVMAVLYIKTRSLFLPILMHAINNGIVWALMLLGGASGRTVKHSTLATLQTQGRAALLVLSLIFIPWALWFLIRHFPNRQWMVPYLRLREPVAEITPN